MTPCNACATGDAGARVGTTATHDELGQLARHLDQLLDVIADKNPFTGTVGQRP
jgi:hypothetical protein